MVKIAAVQFAPSFRKKRENVQRMARLAIEASAEGAKLIVFPELATTGYSYMSTKEAEEDAEIVGFGQPTMDFFLGIAQKTNACLVWGMVEKDSGSGKLYNSQVYLEPGGYFEKYAKINRWGNDFLWATPGKSNPPVIRATFDRKDLRVGLLVCRDIRDKVNDDWTNLYSPGDADVVAFSANFGDGGFPAVSWVDFAMDNKTTLIVSNRYGEEGGKPNKFGGGGSCIIEPSGTVHCDGLQWNADCIIYSEVK